MLTYVRRVVPFGTALAVSLLACSPTTSAPAPTAPAAPPTTVPAPSAKPSVAASVAPSPSAAPPPTLAPTVPTSTPPQATDTAAPSSETVFVGNTDGQGVYLRNTPATNDRLRAYSDGTALQIIGPDVEGDGLQWHHVRAPDGAEGYVPVMYTVTSADATQTPAQ